MKKYEIVSLILIVISFILSFYFYPKIPDNMIINWTTHDTAPKYIGLFLIPVFALIIFLMLKIIPEIDPLKENILKFEKYYETFIVLTIGFLIYVHVLIVLWNYGIKFNLVQFLAPAIAILLYYSGILLEKSERNWFIGVKTPWTISNEKVWKKANKVGGLFLKVMAVLSLLAIIVPQYFLYLIVIPMILSSVYLIVYSYLEYKKEKG